MQAILKVMIGEDPDLGCVTLKCGGSGHLELLAVWGLGFGVWGLGFRVHVKHTVAAGTRDDFHPRLHLVLFVV